MVTKNIAIACQGGGSYAAYAAGALPALLPRFANAGLVREAGGGDREELNLVGISGTSGGAISALLAWYGFITGGALAAQEKLDAFWDANSARLPGEDMWNTAAVNWADALPVDLKCSPYLWPLSEAEEMTTRVWPALAQPLGTLNQWIRPEWFQLDELIRPHVDFEVIAALGAFASIPLEVERWKAIALEAMMVPPDSPRQHELADVRHRIQLRIEQKLAAAHRLEQALNAAGVAPDALLCLALGKWREPGYAFEAQALDRLAQQVNEVLRPIPQLLVGSVRIDNGEFTAFSSMRAPEDGGISLAAVLASACLPWLFRAQEVRQFDPHKNVDMVHRYWDGLFSQNPPIKNFMSDLADDSRKPDGIWVLQINPDDFHVEEMRRRGRPDALSGNLLWETRDALSGNLSLNQEIAFVEAINRRVDAGTAGADKHIKIDRIVMDAGAVQAALGPRYRLGVASKYDRSMPLREALAVHGREQAERFIRLREHVEQVSGNLGAMLQRLSAPALGAPELLGNAVTAAGSVRDAQLVVDGIIVHRERHADGVDEPLASVRWHTRGAHLDGTELKIEGDTGLYSEGGMGESWRLCQVSVAGQVPAAPH